MYADRRIVIKSMKLEQSIGQESTQNSEGLGRNTVRILRHGGWWMTMRKMGSPKSHLHWADKLSGCQLLRFKVVVTCKAIEAKETRRDEESHFRAYLPLCDYPYK